MELQVNVDNIQVSQDWNQETETLLNGWASECKKHANSHYWKQKVCKYIHMFILLSTMILSYIFGSAGLAVSKDDNSTISVIQNYILLVVGILTTLLKIMKLEKRAEMHKKKYHASIKLNQTILLQLALPTSSRKPCVAFFERVNGGLFRICGSAKPRWTCPG